MQNPLEVLEVVTEIADCDFATGMYAYTTGNDIRWVAFAAHGEHRRYFTVSDLSKANPTINLLDRSESEKSIDKVNMNKVVGTVDFQVLVRNGFSGVLRGLGLYRALAERGSLYVTDFKPVVWKTPNPVGYFSAMIYHVDSLEMADGLPSGDLKTKEAAHTAAKKWDDGEGKYFGVVIDHQGNAVAVYHKGEQIA